ncbi:MAG TPA: transcription antitermination factor NusB [Phycisphaerae bacterium]|nr:transcription antitermination factor NusB [Phycisphaerae bacterium]
MAIDRHKARILGMQALCQLDAQGDEYLPKVATFLADHIESGETLSYAHDLVELAWRERDVVEKEIAQHSKGWTMARMSSVDRNVLRVALAEFDLKQAPPKVIINEAIEIAKEFGSAESGAFVNGILDKVWATIDPDAREQKG